MDSIDIFNERLVVITQQLHQLYEPDEAMIWLITPQRSLSGEPPVDLLWCEDGYLKVTAMIERVLDGAFI